MIRNTQFSKKLAPVAGAALLAFAAVPSFAQSSVTLFGIVDAGVRYVENGKDNSITSASSNGINTSRLGFRGVEDLGDGLKAGFWLETGFSPAAPARRCWPLPSSGRRTSAARSSLAP